MTAEPPKMHVWSVHFEGHLEPVLLGAADLIAAAHAARVFADLSRHHYHSFLAIHRIERVGQLANPTPEAAP